MSQRGCFLEDVVQLYRKECYLDQRILKELYNYSTYCTNRVPTRSVRQVRVYAFGAPTTRLCVWCTYKALTNQGEDALVYKPYSLLYTIDSHHHPKEYTILYVFRAPGYDSLVLLSQYEQLACYFSGIYLIYIQDLFYNVDAF